VATVTATPVPTLQSYSSADIGNHLVEIAFGPDNSVIKKPTKDLLVVSCVGMYKPDDVALLNTFIGQFNNYSSTTKIAESINFGSAGDIRLDFMPAATLNQVQIDEDTSTVYKDMQTGVTCFIKTPDTTYVNSDITGNARSRWILRAFLYNLGFYGETVKYSDSLFYAGTTDATHLSAIDLKALQLMYGKKITNGMTKSSVKSTV